MACEEYFWVDKTNVLCDNKELQKILHVRQQKPLRKRGTFANHVNSSIYANKHSTT